MPGGFKSCTPGPEGSSSALPGEVRYYLPNDFDDSFVFLNSLIPFHPQNMAKQFMTTCSCSVDIVPHEATANTEGNASETSPCIIR